MSKTTLQLRRGTTTDNASFTGALGEVIVDTTRKTLVVHDGTTVGGSALATLDSPTFSGTPTAPTPTSGNNSSKIATTAFVQSELASYTPTIPNSDAILEGDVNLFFNNTRARGAISVTGDLTYVGGVIGYSTPLLISAFSNDVGYLTSASIKTEISATGSISYDSGTGIISYTEAVHSVNGQTGAIVLTTDNIGEGLTNKYATASTVRSFISAGTGVSFSTGVIALANTSITLNSKVISLTSGSAQTVTTDDITEGSTNKYASSTTVRSYFSAGTGVTISSGQVSIGQAIGSAASPTFAGLTVVGDVAIDSNTFKLDSTNNRVGIVNSNPTYELDVTGDINFTGKLRVNGAPGTSGYVLQSKGSGASPQWVAVSSALPEIAELDAFNQHGGATVFTPTNNGNAVTISAPIQALVVKNGITLRPFTATIPITTWMSFYSYGDYTLNSLGQLVFTSPPQKGDTISVRVLVGNTSNPINTKYPFRAIDIALGT